MARSQDGAQRNTHKHARIAVLPFARRHFSRVPIASAVFVVWAELNPVPPAGERLPVYVSKRAGEDLSCGLS